EFLIKAITLSVSPSQRVSTPSSLGPFLSCFRPWHCWQLSRNNCLPLSAVLCPLPVLSCLPCPHANNITEADKKKMIPFFIAILFFQGMYATEQAAPAHMCHTLFAITQPYKPCFAHHVVFRYKAPVAAV